MSGPQAQVAADDDNDDGGGCATASPVSTDDGPAALLRAFLGRR